MQDENLIRPIDPPFDIEWVKSLEEHKCRLAELFRLDIELLRGPDPFSEPSYVEAEWVRRSSIEELNRRLNQ